MDRDLEVRVYLTIRRGTQVEWQVTSTELDGQVKWEDGQVYQIGAYRSLLHRDLSRAVTRALRHAVYLGATADL